MLYVDIAKQLADFNLQIRFLVENNIVVLFGPSGCGKTTTLRCIAGLMKPDSGVVRNGDEILYSSSTSYFIPPHLRRMGYMFQDYALFPHMNVRENIWYGVKQEASKADQLYSQLLTLLKIEHLAERFPDKLSGGEKQRVALARALMAEPSVLLLDEPLTALDNDTRLELQTELKRMQQIWNIPFILVTHDPREARTLGDKIVFLENGSQIAAPVNWDMNYQSDLHAIDLN